MAGDATELTEEQEKLPVALATFGRNSTSVFDDWGWGWGVGSGGGGGVNLPQPSLPKRIVWNVSTRNAHEEYISREHI